MTSEQTKPFWGYFDLVLFIGAAVPALALSTGALLLLAFVIGPPSRTFSVLIMQFLAYGFWFAALYAIFHFRYRRPFWQSLGWHAPRSLLLRSLLLGPALAVTIALLGNLMQTPDIQVPMMELLDSPASIALVGFFAVTLGPICEELVFRGFLLPLLTRTLGAALAIVVAAAPFALLHGPQYGWSWRHILLIGVAGTAFGWLKHVTGSTQAATALHATYNLAFFAGFLLTQGDKLPKW